MKSIYTFACTIVLQLPAVVNAQAMTTPAKMEVDKFATTNRIGCVEDFDGFHFNLN